MTATLEDVREALAAALEGIGVRGQPYLRSQVNPPEAQINIAGPTQRTFSNAGQQEYTASIVIYDQMTDERSTQRRFDELRDPFHARSVKRAIDDSTALAGLDGIDFFEVGPGGDVEPVTVGTVDYLRVVWPVPFVIHQED